MLKLLPIIVISTSILLSSVATAKKTNDVTNEPGSSTVSFSSYELVNINHADIATLAKLKGVGNKRAQAIVEFRNKNGKFQTLNDLKLVKGIGAKVLEANVGRITI